MDRTIVSVWSSMLKDLPPKEAIDTYLELGFEGFELSRDHLEMIMEEDSPIAVAKELSAYAKGKNFAIPQAHLPMYDLSLSSRADEYIGEQRRRIEVLLSMDSVESIVIHLGKGLVRPPKDIPDEYVTERMVDAVNKLKDMVEGTKSYLCIENLVANCRTSDVILDILSEVNSPNVAVCYDTGHQHQNEKDESASHFIEALGKYIKALHFDDNDGLHEQHLMPYALGLNLPEHGARRLDVDEVLFGLKNIGFKGLFNFELPGENVCPLEVRLLKMRYLKALGEFMLNRMNKM